ncbi:hypothetical protein Tco_1005867 [Tanacetum coccineum]|uniref:Uncharacterized protein n=1 Tax=Tanacetum coccineum TaxID=301880 RepID=A0ABQ5FH16_9ASTR
MPNPVEARYEEGEVLIDHTPTLREVLSNMGYSTVLGTFNGDGWVKSDPPSRFNVFWAWKISMIVFLLGLKLASACVTGSPISLCLFAVEGPRRNSIMVAVIDCDLAKEIASDSISSIKFSKTVLE